MIRGILKGTLNATKLLKFKVPCCYISETLDDALPMDIKQSDYADKRVTARLAIRGAYLKGLTDCKEFFQLLKLALLFDYDNDKFWRQITKTMGELKEKFPYETKIKLIKLSKAFGRQNDASFKLLVKDLVCNITQVKAVDLIDVAIGSLYLEQLKKKYLESVEDLLIKQSESLRLAKLCEFLYELYVTNVPMVKLLKHLKDPISMNIKSLPKSSYKSILLAYGSLYPEEYPEMLKLIEEQTVSCMNDFTTKELTDLISAFANNNSGSEALFLQFDKIIGMAIDQITVTDVAPVLAAFLHRGYYREKLFLHYIKKIKSNAHILPVDHLASLSETYKKLGLLSKVQNYLIPLIIKNKMSLDKDSFLRVLYSYSGLELTQKIYKEIVPVALELIDSCSPFYLARIGYAFGLADHVKVANAALERLAQENEDVDSIGALHFLETAIRYKAGEEIMKVAQDLVLAHIKEYDKDDLAKIGQYSVDNKVLKEALKQHPLS